MWSDITWTVTCPLLSPSVKQLHSVYARMCCKSLEKQLPLPTVCFQLELSQADILASCNARRRTQAWEDLSLAALSWGAKRKRKFYLFWCFSPLGFPSQNQWCGRQLALSRSLHASFSCCKPSVSGLQTLCAREGLMLSQPSWVTFYSHGSLCHPRREAEINFYTIQLLRKSFYCQLRILIQLCHIYVFFSKQQKQIK